jgi:hypothetical protein
MEDQDDINSTVLRMRRCGKTLVAIADELGISRECVRQREARALLAERRKGDVWFTISERARNCLFNWLGTNTSTSENYHERQSENRVTPEQFRSHFASKEAMLLAASGQPNVGKKTLAELAAYFDK